MTWLLDTNIVSAAMSADPRVIERLAALHHGHAAISTVTYAEVTFGLDRAPQAMARKRELFERLMEHVEVLSWDRDAAIAYSKERLACEREGRRIDQADLMILAHAASSGRVLVTRDATLRRRNGKGPHRLRVEGW